MTGKKRSRREALKSAGIGFAALPTIGKTHSRNLSSNRPNIMVINCHDVGRQLGCYGRGLETPNLDRLASQGVRLDNVFSPAPFCSPSRCSRLTGLYPTNHGSIGSSSFAWGIRKGLKTLPMILSEHGYDTHLFGLQHETKDVKTLGYDHTRFGVGSPGAPRSALDVAHTVINFLDEYDSSGKPFYMDIGFSEAHMGLPRGGLQDWVGTDAPQRFKPKYVPKSEVENYTGELVVGVDHPEDPYRVKYDRENVQPLPYLPDKPGIRDDLADLNSVITNVIDSMVGRILDKLRGEELEKDTIVVFTTDHGIDMPRAKGTLYDSGTEVAMIMSCPGRFEFGRVENEMLSLVDFLPTVLEIAEAPVPSNIDGLSFLPLIEGREYGGREELFLENTWHGFYEPMRGIRTKRFKYIRNFDLKKQYWAIESKAAREVLGRICFGVKPLEELYDLEKDPFEQENLAPSRSMLALMGGSGRQAGTDDGHPDYKETLEDLRSRLREHMVETSDLLLKGPVAHPCFDLIWD